MKFQVVAPNTTVHMTNVEYLLEVCELAVTVISRFPWNPLFRKAAWQLAHCIHTFVFIDMHHRFFSVRSLHSVRC